MGLAELNGLPALRRALRRTFTEGNGGFIRDDLAGAIFDAAIEVVETQPVPEVAATSGSFTLAGVIEVLPEVPTNESFTLDDVIEAWPEVLDVLRAPVRAAVQDAQPIALDAGVIVFGAWPRRRDAINDRFRRDAREIKEAFSARLGIRPRFTVRAHNFDAIDALRPPAVESAEAQASENDPVEIHGLVDDAAIEVVESRRVSEVDDEDDDLADEEDDDLEEVRYVSIAEINGMFALDLGNQRDGWADDLDRRVIPLDDRPVGVALLADYLLAEWDLVDVLLTVASSWSVVASSPEGTATMMSDGGIGLYEFTLDDGVYFFTHCELDIEEPSWWFAHVVTDSETRANSIEAGRVAIGDTEDAGDE